MVKKKNIKKRASCCREMKTENEKRHEKLLRVIKFPKKKFFLFFDVLRHKNFYDFA
jgi:hypothetical protein